MHIERKRTQGGAGADHTAPTPEYPTPTIRSALMTDARAVGEVFDAAVRVGWMYLGELVREPMFSVEEWQQMVADHVLQPNSFLVAVDDVGAISGFIVLMPEASEVFLLFVHPSIAGRGIGKMLLGAGESVLREAGCVSSILFTHEQNTRAQRVYSSVGYSADGTIRESTFREVPIREIRMSKTL